LRSSPTPNERPIVADTQRAADQRMRAAIAKSMEAELSALRT
jgi:hypothetical protein